MTRHTANDLARIIHIDSTTTVITIDAALRHINDTIAGYPTSTPLASPSSGGRWLNEDHPADNDPGKDTTVERNAFHTDIALRDSKRITQLARQTAELIAELADLTSRWGIRGVDATTVGNKLADAITNIYCDNCTKHGFNEVRREGGRQCDFCARFAHDYNPYQAPRTLLDIHTRRGRVNSADIDRAMTTQHGPDWRKKLKKKPKGKAA